MLPQKTITKKEKKKASRKKIGLLLIILGLFFLSISALLLNVLSKDRQFLSPLAGNQKSVDLRLEDELRKREIKYLSFQTNEDLTLTIKLDGNGDVIIDTRKEISNQLSSLQLILGQLKIEGKTFSRLDFRYDKPFIAY